MNESQIFGQEVGERYLWEVRYLTMSPLSLQENISTCEPTVYLYIRLSPATANPELANSAFVNEGWEWLRMKPAFDSLHFSCDLKAIVFSRTDAHSQAQAHLAPWCFGVQLCHKVVELGWQGNWITQGLNLRLIWNKVIPVHFLYHNCSRNLPIYHLLAFQSELAWKKGRIKGMAKRLEMKQR